MVDSRSELNEAYNRVVARYYDAIYSVAPGLESNRDYYVGLAERAAGPVLELGCGTGRVLLELARRHIPCVGLDSSRAMLDMLRAKAGALAPELVLAQMQSFDLGARRFKLICAPFRGFQHLYDLDDQRSCLACVIAHLESGGTFAFDVAASVEDQRGPAEEPERLDSSFDHARGRVKRYVSKRRDPAARLTVLTMRFELERVVGTSASEQEVINMRWFEPDELRGLMRGAGFVDIGISGDFSSLPASEASSALVVVGSKP